MIRAERIRISARTAAWLLTVVTVLAAIGIFMALGAPAGATVRPTGPLLVAPTPGGRLVAVVPQRAGPLLVATTPAESAASVTGLPVTGQSVSEQSSEAGSSVSPSAGSSSSEPITGSSTSPEPSAASSQAAQSSGPTTVSASPSASTVDSAAASSPTAAPITVVQTLVPATSPAAAQSEIGRGTVLIALAVLLAALVVVVLAVVAARRHPRSVKEPARPAPPTDVPPTDGPPTDGPPTDVPLTDVPPTDVPPTDVPPTGAAIAVGAPTESARIGSSWSSPIDGSSLDELMAFMVVLGDTMVDSGDPVTHVNDCLRRVARANAVRGAEIIVLPTALIITLPGLGEARTEVAATGGSRLRLDQVEAVFTVADAAERGEIGPRAGMIELRTVRDLPAPYGFGVTVAGHAVIAMGLAIILAGGWTDIAVAAVLGAGVGVIKQLAARRRLAVQVFLPVLCAFLVAAAVALLGRTQVDPALLPPILGALVTFIPGGLLTTAVIELATGQMISGAGRFVYGSLQLVLLSLGIVAGLQFVGIPAVTVAQTQASLVGAIAPWIGVLIFGVGVLLSYSGRADSLGWMLLVLYVAYAGQVIGGLLFGSSLSAFVGAAVMTPVAVFVATRRTGPPTLVTFLPAFWLLVPGAIALVGVTQVMGAARADGLSSILSAGVTIVSIALGVVLGLGVGDGVTRLFGPPVTAELRSPR